MAFPWLDLPERQAKQHFHHQAELNRRIGKYRWSTPTPSLGSMSALVLVEPNQQRTTPLHGLVVGLPARRAIAGRYGLTHVEHLNLLDSQSEPRRRRVL